MKKTIVFKLIAFFLMQAILLLQASGVHAQNVTCNNTDTLAPVVRLEDVNFPKTTHQLYHIFKYVSVMHQEDSSIPQNRNEAQKSEKHAGDEEAPEKMPIKLSGQYNTSRFNLLGILQTIPKYSKVTKGLFVLMLLSQAVSWAFLGYDHFFDPVSNTALTSSLYIGYATLGLVVLEIFSVAWDGISHFFKEFQASKSPDSHLKKLWQEKSRRAKATIETMPKPRNIIERSSDSLGEPHTYYDYETEPVIEPIAVSKSFSPDTVASGAKQREEVFTAQGFLLFSIIGTVLAYTGMIATSIFEPIGVKIFWLGIAIGSGFGFLTSISFFIDLFINYNFNKDYYKLPPVKLSRFKPSKTVERDDSTYNFFSRLGFHKRLSYKEHQLAPDFAKNLHIIGKQTIKTDELGKVTVYFANVPDVRKNPAYSAGRAIHFNGKEKKIYIFLDYLQHELNTQIIPYLEHKKIRIPAMDLLSILLSDEELSANLFALIMVYPQIQRMLLKRPLNEYIQVLQKRLGNLFTVDEFKLKVSDDLSAIARRNGNNFNFKKLWEKKLNQYSAALSRKDEAAIVKELEEEFGLSLTLYIQSFFKAENKERNDRALEEVLDLIGALETIERFLSRNLNGIYRKDPLLLQKELLHFTFDLTDHKVPLELIYSLIDRDFYEKDEEEILEILTESAIIRHLGQMHLENQGITGEDADEQEILWMLKHNVPLFLVLKNPLRAVLAGKSGNGTFATVAKLIGIAKHQAHYSFTKWLNESGILEMDDYQKEQLSISASSWYEAFMINTNKQKIKKRKKDIIRKPNRLLQKILSAPLRLVPIKSTPATLLPLQQSI